MFKSISNYYKKKYLKSILSAIDDQKDSKILVDDDGNILFENITIGFKSNGIKKESKKLKEKLDSEALERFEKNMQSFADEFRTFIGVDKSIIENTKKTANLAKAE